MGIYPLIPLKILLPTPPSKKKDFEDPKKVLVQSLKEGDRYLKEAAKQKLSPEVRRGALYLAIRSYNTAVWLYEGMIDYRQNFSAVNWDLYRKKILQVGLTIPGLSENHSFDSTGMNQRCSALRDITQPQEMVCRIDGQERKCKPGEKRVERINPNLFFCYPNNWTPSKILTRKKR